MAIKDGAQEAEKERFIMEELHCLQKSLSTIRSIQKMTQF